MRYDPEQLAALQAVVDEGTFEAAARALVVSQSAISQRIKALETRTGRVLIVRTTPCRPTADGEHLVRLARQLQLLSDEASAQLGAETAHTTTLPVAINADSLATWFTDVLGVVAGWDDVTLQVHAEDQEDSAALLRAGTVMGAVTADPVTVQGCSSEPLGVMRYLPVATPALLERHASTRRVHWDQLPVLRFNERDDLQERVLIAHGVAGHHHVPTHRVPSVEVYAHAVRIGLGWGALPEAQLGSALADGDLVRLPGARPIDVLLHWQRWRLSAPTLDRLTAVLLDAAAALRPVRRSHQG